MKESTSLILKMYLLCHQFFLFNITGNLNKTNKCPNKNTTYLISNKTSKERKNQNIKVRKYVNKSDINYM